MFPFRKKKEIIIGPAKSMEIRFVTAWSKQRNEVVIMTKDGPILLNGKNELYINVSAEKADPVKIQIIPDFKNRVLNFVEILDPYRKKKFPSGPKLIFKGVNVDRKGNISFGEYLKKYDDSIEEFGKVIKKYRRTRNIFVPVNILLAIWNLYVFVIKTDIFRYLNLGITIFSVLMALYIWSWDRKINKDFSKHKEFRENFVFGIVKEK